MRAATVGTEGIYRGRQAAEATSYIIPETPLEWSGTYYWRVDEVGADGTIAEGKVWSFDTADYLIVDDFEGYDDEENFMWETWIDGWVNGTGSFVGYSTTICFPGVLPLKGHSGEQPMPFEYDNTVSPWYSEASRDWEEPQDWTRFGVDTLTLYLMGPGVGTNDPGQVYVGLADEAGNLAVVNHPDPLVVQSLVWERWDIPLVEFASAGVDVTRVTRMIVGVGDRDDPTPGGKGLMHFDDFRLTRSEARSTE